MGTAGGTADRGVESGGIDRAVEAAEARWPDKPYVVPPKQTPYTRPGRRDDTLAKLPPVQCISRWRGPFRKGTDGDWASLTIIWWQDLFALPIAPEVEAAIQGIDWMSLAMDDGV